MKQVDLRIVYITAKDMLEAKDLSEALVSRKLVACTNIHADVASLFLWDGKRTEANEVVIIAKTIQERIPDVMSCVQSKSSYACPCILVLPVADANPEYAAWVESSVKE